MFKGLYKIAGFVGFSFAAGCAGVFWQDPYFEVQNPPSMLDWVEIHYYDSRSKPTLRSSVYMQGNGFVEVKRGTSELISNDFAKRYEADTWRNIRSQRITVNPQNLRNLWQTLVNEGLMDRSLRPSRTETNKFVAVKANIQNHTYSEPHNIFEIEGKLGRLLERTVMNFVPVTL